MPPKGVVAAWAVVVAEQIFSYYYRSSSSSSVASSCVDRIISPVINNTCFCNVSVDLGACPRVLGDNVILGALCGAGVAVLLILVGGVVARLFAGRGGVPEVVTGSRVRAAIADGSTEDEEALRRRARGEIEAIRRRRS